jgi:hypothetical protein
LWDIYERMKTLLIGNKKQSSELLINVIANKLYNNDSNAEKYTNALLTEEFKCLTEYGNKYTIRHTETDKHDTHNKPELLSYLIKRISALIELCLPYTKKNNNYL